MGQSQLPAAHSITYWRTHRATVCPLTSRAMCPLAPQTAEPDLRTVSHLWRPSLVGAGALRSQLLQQGGLPDPLHADDHQLHPRVRLGVLQYRLRKAETGGPSELVSGDTDITQYIH